MSDKNLDAAGALKRASGALGIDGLKTLRYSVSGAEFVFGQSARPGGPWPKYSFDLMITCLNYETGAWSEELTGQRIRAEMRGGGEPTLPRGTTYAKDGYSWSQVGPRSYPAPWHAENRLHQVWITPHGAIKAAIRNNASLQWQTQGGKSVAAMSFIEPGRFAATVFLNEEFLVERVDSRVAVTYCGVLPFVTTYSDYQNFGAVKFPTHIRRSQGAFPILEAVVKEVHPNVAFDFEVPEAVRQAAAAQPKTAVKVADGVWEIPGSHNCVAIEMRDHIVVVEAPLTEGTAKAVFEAVKREIPGKPIRYVINTHHHIDHSGGLRAAIDEGATIVTHALNKPLYQGYFAAPRTLCPVESAAAKQQAVLKTVDDKLVMSDGTRTVEIHHVRGNDHAEDLIMAYLPGERLLIEGDAFTPGPPNSPPPAQPDAFAVNLVENLERLKLPIDRILPMHGPIVPLQELYRAVGRTH
jgi:glyoxylase-like metal-dependent hydrolase (beta-lactamase superfamily II)